MTDAHQHPTRDAAGPVAASLPVDGVLPELRTALSRRGVAVLEAPPGAGKTTRVPLDLLRHEVFDGRLLVLEPRRLAARGAARRLAAQLGEDVGVTVGLVTRDERRRSRATRIEVVTDGVLLRRLQRDPSLAGVGMLLFDEFHERRLETDLGLAFALETRSALRDDLRVLVTSATLDGTAVAALLDPDQPAPVIRAEGRTHPVTVSHDPDPPPGGLLDATVDAIGRALAPDDGDVLVFLPGVRELRAVARRLPPAPGGVPTEVRLLHGGLPPREQDAALVPGTAGRRRVVLATDVAETSLTVPGIVAVVDAGRSREPRFDARTGMTGLVTVPASRGSAEQRAGRAGRVAPGRAIRLWSASAHARRPALATPAIHTEDLTGATLEVAVWGAVVDDLALLDRPDPRSWSSAQEVLRGLGALDDDDRPTAHGRALADLPLHPRLAHLVREGSARGVGGLAADLAGLLADRDPLRPGRDAPDTDLASRVAVLRGRRPPAGTEVRRAALQRARRESARIRRLADIDGGEGDLDAIGSLVALAWPDRVAAARSGRRGAVLLANGRGATVHEADPLAGAPYLAVAAVDRGDDPGGRGPSEARIHLAAAVARDELLDVLGDRIEQVEEVVWRDGDVLAERRRELGALALVRVPWRDPPAADRVTALLAGLAEEGLELLGWRRSDRELRARLQLLHATLGEPWPDVSDGALRDDLARTVGPFLTSARRRADLARIDVAPILLALAPPRAASELDRLVPTHLTVPSGNRIRLRYDPEGGRPVLAVKLQELFGAATTPTVLGGRVPVLVHLLSPAGRPVQVTDDLASFWATGYPQVRAELRGRYRKHPWPEDPTTATPTARTTTVRRR